MPPLLEHVFQSERLAPLRAAHPRLTLDLLQAQWLQMTLFGALACFALAGFAALLRSPEAARRMVGEATPGALGAIRMLVCGVLLISTVWEDLPSTAALPRDLIRPMGVIQLFYLLPGFEAFTASPTALAVFKALTAVVLFLGMIGWRTRWVLPVGAVCYLLVGGLLRQYAWFYHTGLLALYLLIVLCLVPAGDGWSVDRLRRVWRGRPVPDADVPTRRYGWARYALWVALAVPYVAAGLSKLRNGGLFWWDAVNFKYILFNSTLHPMEFDFELSLLLTSAPDAVFEVLALTAVLGEILYGLVLFFRWARWVLPASMLLMHVGILFLQNILFFDLILLQVIFFNLRPLRQAIARRLAERWGRIELVYDGTSAREQHAIRVLQALDLFDRIAFVGRSEVPLWTTMYQGTVYRGAQMYRLLARTVPALWLFIPLLYLPGAPSLVDRVIAASAASKDTTRAQPATPTGSPRLALALTSVLLICWVFRIEFYPFTGMQMFSTRHDPVVTYEQAWAHLRSGDVVRAPIEASIGAMADSRYRRILEMAFDSTKAPLSEEFLKISATRWNRQAPPARQITQIEVQQWQWNFLTEPDHPTFGRLIERRTVPIPPVSTSQP